MNQKIYNLSWSDYECYSPNTFYHENSSQEKFDADVTFLMRKYTDDYLAQETSWAGANGFIDFICTKLPELGYERISPIQFNIFGNMIVENEEHKKDEQQNFCNIIGEENLQKFFIHNKKVSNRLEEHREELRDD